VKPIAKQCSSTEKAVMRAPFAVDDLPPLRKAVGLVRSLADLNMSMRFPQDPVSGLLKMLMIFGTMPD
jgi:hypothetical protein